MAAGKISPLDKKFQEDKLKVSRITNDNLVCKDCKNRYNDKDLPCNTSACMKFIVKPDKVLGGGDCDEYEQETE